MQSPLAGFTPFNNFGWRPQFIENGVTIPAMFHNGADIAAPSGTPIRAARSGVVTWQGWDTIGGGNGVIVGHGAQVSTGYYHMLGPAIVKRGDHVKQGQTIGHVGMSGLATGPHLHFIVWAQGVEVDPYPLITAVTSSPAVIGVGPNRFDPEEDDMKPTVHVRTEGTPEYMRAHPEIGKGLKQYTGPKTGTSRRHGKVTTYLGFQVTADAAIGKAWARMHALGSGRETSRTNRADYIAIQVEASRLAAELG